MKTVPDAAPPMPVAINVSEAFQRMSSLYDSIARRAFEIFEGRGCSNGHDLEDWFQAEAELFHSAHLAIAESEDALVASAEVPGFTANELEVRVEPRRLTITGRRGPGERGSIRKLLYCDDCPNEIFRAVSLPVEVDPGRVTATLRDGILDLAMPKAPQALSIKADWMVRLEDYHSWREP